MWLPTSLTDHACLLMSNFFAVPTSITYIYSLTVIISEIQYPSLNGEHHNKQLAWRLEAGSSSGPGGWTQSCVRTLRVTHGSFPFGKPPGVHYFDSPVDGSHWLTIDSAYICDDRGSGGHGPGRADVVVSFSIDPVLTHSNMLCNEYRPHRDMHCGWLNSAYPHRSGPERRIISGAAKSRQNFSSFSVDLTILPAPINLAQWTGKRIPRE